MEKKYDLDKISYILNGVDQNFNNKVNSIYYYENNCVSLKDIAEAKINRRENKTSYFLDQKAKINSLMEKKFVYCNCIYLSFYSGNTDYNNDYIYLSFEEKYTLNSSECKLFKENNKLSLIEIEGGNFSYIDKIIPALGSELSKTYDEGQIFKAYEREKLFTTDIVNGDFCVKIFRYYITLTGDNFLLGYKIPQKEYYIGSDFEDVKEFVNNVKEELFEKIFVEIEKCPQFMQKDLHDIKNKKIEEEKIKQRLLEIDSEPKHYQKKVLAKKIFDRLRYKNN